MAAEANDTTAVDDGTTGCANIFAVPAEPAITESTTKQTDAVTAADVNTNNRNDEGGGDIVPTGDDKAKQHEDNNEHKELINFVDRCRNCESRNHRTIRCPEPTRCFNCRGLHHIAKDCNQAHQYRCYVCWKADHRAKMCPRCRTCGEPHHFNAEWCMGKIECNLCGHYGHKMEDCLQNDTGHSSFGGGNGTLKHITCYNCHKKGHMGKDCNFCTHCDIDGHNTRRCIRCHRCNKRGHPKRWCPDRPCDECGEPGHAINKCPQLEVSPGVWRAPTTEKFLFPPPGVARAIDAARLREQGIDPNQVQEPSGYDKIRLELMALTQKFWQGRL